RGPPGVSSRRSNVARPCQQNSHPVDSTRSAARPRPHPGDNGRLKFMVRIGQILVSLGTTTENNVARALGVQGFAGGRLGTLLLERGSVGEDDLGEALAQQHGRPYVPWTVLGEVPPDVVASLPAKF